MLSKTTVVVTFDRKIKRSDLNVVIDRSWLSSEFRLSPVIASVLVNGLYQRLSDQSKVLRMLS